MGAERLFLEPPLAPGCEYVLPADAARYLSRVLRLENGAPLVVFDGTGGEYEARVARVERGRVVVATTGFRQVERESNIRLCLAQGIAKGERMDFVVQKSVELGVARIVPLLTERTVVRLDGERARKRRLHWHRTAIAACQQCGRNRVPEIAGVETLSNWLNGNPPGDLKLVLDPRATSGIPDGVPVPQGATLLIGPEGGLSPRELAWAHAAGFTPACLGPRVLRTETAAMIGLAALQLRFGDMDGPRHFSARAGGR